MFLPINLSKTCITALGSDNVKKKKSSITEVRINLIKTRNLLIFEILMATLNCSERQSIAF